MARRWTILPLLAAILISGCKRGEQAAATPAATPTPAIAAAPGAPVTPGLPGAAAPGLPPGAAPSAAPPFDTAKLPAVVARVNGADIKREELLARADGMRKQMQRMGGPPPPQSEEFYRAMLDQLIGSKLLVAEGKKKGYAPSPDEINARLAQIKGNFPDEATFKKQLAAQGMTEQQMANDLTQTLCIQKLVATEVAPAVKVNEQAAREFYQQNLDHMKRPPQVRVRHLLVAVPPKATPEQKQAARTKADGLLARIKKGEDFATLARDNSDDPGSKGDGGLLPWMSSGETVPAFERAAFALKNGQTSEVVETPFGFHILRVEDRRAATTVPFEEARPQIEQVLTRRMTGQALEAKVAELKKTAKVEVLF